MSVSDRLDRLARGQQRDMPDDQQQALAHQPWITDKPQRFDPQPYTQLSKVLEQQGERAGAARVREARELGVRTAAKLRELARIDGTWRRSLIPETLMYLVRRGWDGVFGAGFGYGHQPIYALSWVLCIWGFGVLLYGAAYDARQMAPNWDIILTSAAWDRALAQGCATVQAAGCEVPVHLWLQMPEARDYETFSRGIYALDLFIPLDALGQETTWAPSKTRGTLGWIGHYARLPIQIAGWVITAVGAAVLTGLVGRKD